MTNSASGSPVVGEEIINYKTRSAEESTNLIKEVPTNTFLDRNCSSLVTLLGVIKNHLVMLKPSFSPEYDSPLLC